jgi:U3 small nucleolar RNA-associated protein 6
MGAARVLLQRGLRLNADSVDMWREYVRLELGFVEALRRRWDVLGISLEEEDSSPDRETQGERIDRAEEESMGDTARRAIMDGAIVLQAIDGAAKGEHYSRVALSFIHLRPSLIAYYCVISAADDRAVSESADAYCRISGNRVSPQFVAGSPPYAIG